MNFKKGKLMALTVAVLMGMSAFTSVSADDGQTGTVFKKGAIDGKHAIGPLSDFAKYHVWDSATETYKFTRDSQIQTNEGIFVTTKPIKIVAKNVTLEMTPVNLKGHGKHGNYGGIQINDDREYKAVEGGDYRKMM